MKKLWHKISALRYEKSIKSIKCLIIFFQLKNTLPFDEHYNYYPKLNEDKMEYVRCSNCFITHFPYAKFCHKHIRSTHTDPEA